MSTFTTNINNPEVIAEFPDLSTLKSLFNADVTVEEAANLFADISFRKKLQSILSFKLSDSARTILLDSLKESYIEYEETEGKEVVESNGYIFVEDKLVALYVDSFANGVFENEDLQRVVFTEEVFATILESEDSNFMKVFFSLSGMWDRMLASEVVMSYMNDNHILFMEKLATTEEIPYVKYVSYLAGLDFTKYKDTKFLMEDSIAMDTISALNAPRALERKSSFGLAARALYLFNLDVPEEIGDSEEVKNAVENDSSLEELIINAQLLEIYSQESLLRKMILNNDRFFGMIASQILKLESSLSLSNIFYDENYADALFAFTGDAKLIDLFFESSLNAIYLGKFRDSYNSRKKLNSNVTATINSNYLILGKSTSDFKAKTITVDLNDFNETKLGVTQDIESSSRANYPVSAFQDSTISFVGLKGELMFTNEDNYNLYSDFNDEKFSSVFSADGHMLGINKDGKVVSSRFNTAITTASEIKNVSVGAENAFIKTEDSIYCIGNFGEDKDALLSKIAENKDSISHIVKKDDLIVVLLTDGTLKKVTVDGLEDFSDITAGTNLVLVNQDITVLEGSVVKEISVDGTSTEIATDVSSIKYAQKALLVQFSDDEKLLFKYKDAWNKYSFHINEES